MYDTPTHFLVDLAGHGGRAGLKDGRLVIKGKGGFMTPERAAFVEAHRSELVAILEDEESFRLVMAVAIFDAATYFDLTRCPECGTEHNREIPCYRCFSEAAGHGSGEPAWSPPVQPPATTGAESGDKTNLRHDPDVETSGRSADQSGDVVLAGPDRRRGEG